MKPSEMGLHSTIRYHVSFENETELFEFVENLHDAMSWFIYPNMEVYPELTVKFARHFSLSFNVDGYSDDEIYHLLFKFIDRKRKER